MKWSLSSLAAHQSSSKILENKALHAGLIEQKHASETEIIGDSDIGNLKGVCDHSPSAKSPEWFSKGDGDFFGWWSAWASPHQHCSPFPDPKSYCDVLFSEAVSAGYDDRLITEVRTAVLLHNCVLRKPVGCNGAASPVLLTSKENSE